jgi:hypothetical protein
MKWKTGLLVSAMLFSGCAMTGSGNACAGWKPIRLDAQTIDGMTEMDARAILAHNEFGLARGCWK